MLPPPHARRLSLARSDTIGLVLPDIGNPFFAQLAAAVEEAGDAAGLELILAATLNRPERERAYLQRMRLNHVDGLIFVTNHGDGGQLAHIINASRGIVPVDEDVRGARGPKIFCDNERSGFLAAEYLLQTGHRDLAFIGGPADVMSGADRLRGFRRAVRAAGAPARIVTKFSGPYSIAHGREATVSLLRVTPRPTAAFAASDEIALGGLSVLQESGLQVPRDISVIGFDDVGPLHLFDLPLTAIIRPSCPPRQPPS